MLDLKKRILYDLGKGAKRIDPALGKHKLYAFLKERRMIRADNSPYIEYEQKGYLVCVIKIQPWNGQPYPVTLITEEGLEFIRQLWEESKVEISKFPIS